MLSDDGLTPGEQLAAIRERASALMARAAAGVGDAAGRAARGRHRRARPARARPTASATWLETYFIDQVFPILTPLAVDPAHPFPFLPNGGFSAIFKLQRKDDKRPLMALLPLPPQVDRFVRLPGTAIRFLPLEELIAIFLPRLFPGYERDRARLLPPDPRQRRRDQRGVAKISCCSTRAR